MLLSCTVSPGPLLASQTTIRTKNPIWSILSCLKKQPGRELFSACERTLLRTNSVGLMPFFRDPDEYCAAGANFRRDRASAHSSSLVSALLAWVLDYSSRIAWRGISSGNDDSRRQFGRLADSRGHRFSPFSYCYSGSNDRP